MVAPSAQSVSRFSLWASVSLVVALVVTAHSAAAAGKVAFLTSTYGNGNLFTWADSGGLHGLAAGDAICQARAHAAGLDVGGRVFRAWLSDDTDDAFCRVRSAAGHGKRANNCGGIDPLLFILYTGGPWLRTDGYPFSGTEFQLTGDMPLTPPQFDEKGNAVTGPLVAIWTGTQADGSAAADTCSNWTGPGSGAFGLADATAEAWTDYQTVTCGDVFRLLCFETGTDGPPLPPFEEPGALAFVTSEGGWADLASWPGAVGAGILAGDSICQQAARNAGLPAPDSFVAWLSGLGLNAVNRLTIDGPWKLLNGARIAESKLALTSGSLFAPIAENELGKVQLDTFSVWTGTDASGARTGDDCASWSSHDSSGSPIGTRGIVGRSTADWTGQGAVFCNGYGSIYCLSNVVTIFWDGFESGSTSRWSSQSP